MVVIRPGASVTALHGWEWFVSLRKHMLIASIKQVPDYFMLLPPLRIYLYMAPTSPMRFLKPYLQNRDFSFAQIVLSMNGGSSISTCHLFHLVMSSQFFLSCRVILNPHDSGRNTRMKFSKKSGSPQPFMNYASTLVISMANGFCLCNKLMILPLLCQMRELLTF